MMSTYGETPSAHGVSISWLVGYLSDPFTRSSILCNSNVYEISSCDKVQGLPTLFNFKAVVIWFHMNHYNTLQERFNIIL